MNAKCDTTGCGRYARKASESGRSVRCAMHATSIHTVEVKPDLTPAPSFDEICGVAVEAGVTLAPPTREDSHGVRYCPCGGCIKASSARCSHCSAREA